MGKWKLKYTFPDGCHCGVGSTYYLKITSSQPEKTNTSFPWGVSQLFMEITNASQNTEGDRLFMGKEESEFHVKIKYKTNMEG